MRRLAFLYLRLRGWNIEGRRPDSPKFIAVAAPHTSNWDFVVFLGVLHHFGVRARYLGHAGLFKAPFGWFMRWLGGIPVYHDRPGAAYAEVMRTFDEATEMALVMAPEGTRRRTPGWRSGFYRIGLEAGVPVVPAAIDLDGRRAVIGSARHLTGVPSVDMDGIRSFYTTVFPETPPEMGPIRIAEETTTDGDP